MLAAKWRFAASIVQGVLQFGVGVLLARLLPPEDFGLLALALVVVGLAEMFSDLGLGPAVIQRRPLTTRHVRTAFTMSVLVGLGIAASIFLIAPLAAVVMRSNSLTVVLQTLALIFVITSFGVVARALLRRNLDFRRLFVVDMFSYSIGYGLLAVTLALQGYGVWSLVWASLLQSFLGSVLAFAMVRHAVRPMLSVRELRDLLGFGVGVSLNQIVNYFARNGDNFITGRWLGPHALGIYSRAYNLMLLPQAYIASVASGVLFPAFSEARENLDRLGRAYLLAVQLTALATAPIMAGMIVAAPHMIVGLYGEQWSGAVLPLQVLCGVGLFRAVYHLAGALVAATGHIYAELRRQIVYAALVLGGAFLGLSYGSTGVAVGVSAAIFYMYIAMAQLSLKIVGRSWRDFLSVQLPGVLLGILVGAAALIVRLSLEQQGVSSAVNLAAIIAACALMLPTGIYLLPQRVRPVELFSRFQGSLARLPWIVRVPVTRALRLSV